MKAYIYAIKNVINNKVYVGSTKSLKFRRQDHFTALKSNRHPNIHLQKAYNKYGKDKFHFYQLEECSSDNRKEREIYWISNYDACDRDKGYNICKPNEDGFSCNEETKQRMSEATIRSGVAKAVDMYTTDLQFVGTYDSANLCSKTHNIYSSIILDIMNGKRLTYKGFTFFLRGETPYKRVSPKQRNMTLYHKNQKTDIN